MEYLLVLMILNIGPVELGKYKTVEECSVFGRIAVQESQINTDAKRMDYVYYTCIPTGPGLLK